MKLNHKDTKPRNDSRDDLEETWEISAPPNIAAKLNLEVGEIDAENLSGGMELKVGVGEISAHAPSGNIRAKVGVGDVQIQSKTKSFGNVSLDSNVGDVRLTLEGHKVIYPKPAGAGNNLKLEGPGRDEIDPNVNVGNVELTIDSKG